MIRIVNIMKTLLLELRDNVRIRLFFACDSLVKLLI